MNIIETDLQNLPSGKGEAGSGNGNAGLEHATVRERDSLRRQRSTAHTHYERRLPRPPAPLPLPHRSVTHLEPYRIPPRHVSGALDACDVRVEEERARLHDHA